MCHWSEVISLLLDSALLQFAHEHHSDWSLCPDVLTDEAKLWICTSQKLHSRPFAGSFCDCCVEIAYIVFVTLVRTVTSVIVVLWSHFNDLVKLLQTISPHVLALKWKVHKIGSYWWMFVCCRCVHIYSIFSCLCDVCVWLFCVLDDNCRVSTDWQWSGYQWHTLYWELVNYQQLC